MTKMFRVFLLSLALAAGVALQSAFGGATAALTPAPAPAPAPVVAIAPAAHAQPVVVPGPQAQGQGQQGYTCTSASSCAVLAAALGGPSDAPQAHQPRHRSTQPRAHSGRRSGGAQYEDQPGWSCATSGNHVCGTGVVGGPLADDTCPSGGVRVYGTPHGCRYR